MFLKTTEGSTGRLVQLCGGYFFFYVITGVVVRFFQFGPPKVPGMEYLFYSSIGGSLVCLVVVFALRWYRLESNRMTRMGGIKFPSEFLYIIPSGVCTAVVIPTTTLMYSLPISVMVAMIIMRGSVIVISRMIDAVQIKQGILKKKVYHPGRTGSRIRDHGGGGPFASQSGIPCQYRRGIQIVFFTRDQKRRIRFSPLDSSYEYFDQLFGCLYHPSLHHELL